MEEKKLVPKRRFRGFEGEWEAAKLEDIFNNIGNAFVGTATPYYVEQGHLYLQSNNVKDGKINLDEQVFINNDFYLKQKHNWLRTGDIVMVQSGHVGHTAVITKSLNNSVAHALIMFRDYKINTIPEFINNQFQTNNIKSKIKHITTGNTIKHILASDMKRFRLYLTVLKEQQKIGRFFKVLDERIANQERKIAKVKALKSAYLTEMFPQKDETVPKRRFKGFDNTWGNYLLKDVIEYEEKGIARADMVGGTTPYLDTNYLNGGSLTYVHSKMNVNKDDLIILWDGSQAGTVYHGFAGALGSTLKVFKPKYSGSFLYYHLKMQQKLIFSQYRTPNIPHVINTFSEEYIVNMPSLEEQQKIGEFFKNLDEQIDVEEKKLAKLKAMKEAYLEEMFV